jgi:hypothetical protein
MALETLIPPPPGSCRGSPQRSFLSGTTFSTFELLSMQGFIVNVHMVGDAGRPPDFFAFLFTASS